MPSSSSEASLSEAIARALHGASGVAEAVKLVEDADGSAVKTLCESLLDEKEERVFSFDSIDKDEFDKNGILYGLGTGFGVKDYENPSVSKAISITFSGDADNYYSTSTGHKGGWRDEAAKLIAGHKHPGANATMYSNGAAKAWFTIDLKHYKLRLTHVAYRGDFGGGQNHPKTFAIQGCNDNESWVTLKEFKDGKAVSGGDEKGCSLEGGGRSGKNGSWTIEEEGQLFQFFRIQNLGHPNHLCCSGLELYGSLVEPRQVDVLMLSPACAPLVDALVAKHPAFAADVGSPATLLAALRSGAVPAVAKLLAAPFDAPVTEPGAALEALVKDGGKLLKSFVLFDDKDQNREASAELVKALSAKSKVLLCAVVALLDAALLGPTVKSSAAMTMLELGADLDRKTVDLLLAEEDGATTTTKKKPKKIKCALEKLVLNPSCTELVDALAARSARIKAVVDSSEMFLASLASPKTAAVALHLIERRGAAITDEVRSALLSKSGGGGGGGGGNDPGLDMSTLARWYTFDDQFVENGDSDAILVHNHAHLVNATLSPDEAESLSVADEHKAPRVAEKFGRAVVAFEGGMALASKGLGGLPSGNEAYTVEVELTRPEGHGVAFFLGKPNRGSGCTGIWLEEGGRKFHHFWWSNDCDKDGIDEKTWNRGAQKEEEEEEDDDDDEKTPWIKLAASWDPEKKERTIYVNGVKVHQDDAQGREHEKPTDGDDDSEACVLALGDLVGDGDPFRGGLSLNASIADVRVWRGVVEPSLLHSKLQVGERSAMEALALSASSDGPVRRLVEALCARDDALKAAAESGDVLVAALHPRTAAVAMRLLMARGECGVEVVDPSVVDALLAKDATKPKQKSLLEKLVLGGRCPALVDALCARSGAVKAAVESGAMLRAALAPKTVAVALSLLEERGVEVTEDVREHLDAELLESLIFACKDPAMKQEEQEEQEQKDGSKKAATVPLIECLCRRNKDVLATVTGADVLARFMTPERAPIALELLDTFNVEVSDELAEKLVAKDDKGKSKLRGLLTQTRIAKDVDEAFLEQIAKTPKKFALLLSGHHDHPDCNGKYVASGKENGRTKWVKEGSANVKLIWTGRSWDCYWGGSSPEASKDTPVPPLTGYDKDKGKTDIKVRYEDLEGVSVEGVAMQDEGPNDCEVLAKKLCAESPTVREAAASVDMFAALATPSTAGAALMLVEDLGLEIDDALVRSLMTGQGVEYHVNKQKGDWQFHEDAAIAWGGHLTSVLSKEEQELVKKLSGGKCAWIGGRRKEPHRGNGTGPEHWEWSDGSPWEFEFWGPGEPNNCGEREDRVHLLEWYGPEMKWNDIHGDESNMSFGIYKRGGRPWDQLVLSEHAPCKKLVWMISQIAAEVTVPASVVACATPAGAKAACEIIAEHPEIELDASALAPLLAEDAKGLKKLVNDASPASAQLVELLCAKCDAVKAAVTSEEMLSFVLSAPQARVALLFLEAKGEASFLRELAKISAKGAAPEEKAEEE